MEIADVLFPARHGGNSNLYRPAPHRLRGAVQRRHRQRGGHAGYQFRFFQQYLRRFMERRLVRRQQRRRSGHVLHGPGIGCPQHRHYPVPQEIAGHIVLFIGSVLHMGNVMRLCIPRQLRPGHPQ